MKYRRSEINGDYVIGNWKKEIACYIVAEILAEFCPIIMWKVEYVSVYLGYLAKNIFM